MGDQGPRDNLKVFVVANPDVLEKIQKVGYIAFPYFDGPNTTDIMYHDGNMYTNVTSANNNFTLNLNVWAGPKINATVYFKDGQVIKYPTLDALTPCPTQLCPYKIQIKPTMQGSNINLDGTVIGKDRAIYYIFIDWGDGNSSEIKNNPFSISHVYSKINSHNIKITVIGDKFSLVQSIGCPQCGNTTNNVSVANQTTVGTSNFTFGFPIILINTISDFFKRPIPSPTCIMSC